MSFFVRMVAPGVGVSCIIICVYIVHNILCMGNSILQVLEPQQQDLFMHCSTPCPHCAICRLNASLFMHVELTCRHPLNDHMA